MSSFYDDASLVVIPSGYKTSKVYAEKPTDGSGDLAFTRTGDTATRVNSAGIIEKVRTNLVLQSQTFDNASWLKSLVGGASAPVVTANNTTAPDGTLTADKIVFVAPTSVDISQVTQNITLTGVANGSVYLKAFAAGDVGKILAVRFNSGSYALVTLTADWQRFSVSQTAIVGTFDIALRPAVGSSSGTVSVYAWGAQLETGDIATAYIPTTTAAVSVGPVANVPRLDYLGSTCPRLLLEPQRTNLVTNSERFTSWLSAGGTVTSNTAISPDGYQNADTLTGARYQSSFASNQYTVSCFAKKVDGDGRFVLRLDAPTLFSAQFNLNNGTIDSTSAGYTSTITNFGNGWYRCTLTTPASTTINNFVLVSATGSTASTYIWGAQLEAGTYATSLIPTLAASATRGADACSKTGISSLIGQTEGTIFVDLVWDSSIQDVTSLDVTGSNGKLIWFRGIGVQFYGDGTTLLADLSRPGAVEGTRYKLAFIYGANDFKLYRNGALVATDTSGTLSSGFSAIALNSVINQANLFNQVLFFPTKLTNAELITLTTL
jgi:hypothetical protein